MIKTMLTEVATTEVAETTRNAFMQFMDNVFVYDWLKVTFFVLGGLCILGILGQAFVKIAKGK